MKKLDFKDIKREDGLPFHDKIRDGRSIDLDHLKVSFILQELIKTVNQLVDLHESAEARHTEQIMELRKEIEGLGSNTAKNEVKRSRGRPKSS